MHSSLERVPGSRSKAKTAHNDSSNTQKLSELAEFFFQRGAFIGLIMHQSDFEFKFPVMSYRCIPFKFGNFDHLRINDGDLNLIQYLSLDIVFLWSILLISLLYGLM